MKKLLLAALTITSATAFAQMPVPLLDNAPATKSIDIATWKAAASTLQAVLECRTKITPKLATLRPLIPKNETDQWELTPPEAFTVFGLPVSSVVIYMDSEGQMGHTYTSVITGKSLAVATAAAKINPKKTGRTTKVGDLTVHQPRGPDTVEVHCTVAGQWQD
jgi:hypothetical protein